MNPYMKELRDAILAGPVNVTAYYIYKYLADGATEAAEYEYQMDGDKLSRPYKEIIQKILGCRNHLKVDCQDSFCKRSYGI